MRDRYELVLIYWLFRSVLETNFMVAFWWGLATFVVAHIETAFKAKDLGRLLDSFNIGTLNTIMFVYFTLVCKFPLWQIVVSVMIFHIIYNFIFEIFKHLKMGILIRIVRASLYSRASDESMYEIGDITRVIQYLTRSTYRKTPGLTEKAELK